MFLVDLPLRSKAIKFRYMIHDGRYSDSHEYSAFKKSKDNHNMKSSAFTVLKKLIGSKSDRIIYSTSDEYFYPYRLHHVYNKLETSRTIIPKYSTVLSCATYRYGDGNVFLEAFTDFKDKIRYL